MADNEGNTALHYALKDGAIDNARYLIKKDLPTHAEAAVDLILRTARKR